MSQWEEIEPDTKAKIARALSNIDLLKIIGPEQVQKLIDEAQIRNFEGGEIILMKGEISEALYVIGSGKAVICLKKNPVKLGGSDYFGEMSLFLKRPVTCSVKSSEEGVRVLSLPGKVLKEMVDANPQAKKLIEDKMNARGIPPTKK